MDWLLGAGILGGIAVGVFGYNRVANFFSGRRESKKNDEPLV